MNELCDAQQYPWGVALESWRQIGPRLRALCVAHIPFYQLPLLAPVNESASHNRDHHGSSRSWISPIIYSALARGRSVRVLKLSCTYTLRNIEKNYYFLQFTIASCATCGNSKFITFIIFERNDSGIIVSQEKERVSCDFLSRGLPHKLFNSIYGTCWWIKLTASTVYAAVTTDKLLFNTHSTRAREAGDKAGERG